MISDNYLEKSRIASLQASLQKEALLIEDPIDLYYLTGLTLSTGKLWVAKEEARLLVDGRYIESAQKGVCPASLFSSEEVASFLQRNGIQEVRFDGAKTSFERSRELQKAHPSVRFVSIPFLTKDLRLIKDASEIKKLQKSADLLWEGFSHIRTLLKEGLSEKELALAFTLFCFEKGAEGLSFDPIIAFGENSAMPHYRAGDRRLRKGDIILIDVGVLCNGYHSDMTRILFFGPPNPFLVDWYSIVLEAHGAALELCKAGVHVKELDQAARDVFKKHGVEQYFVHGLGHGVGLEIHEFPKIRFDAAESDLILPAGAVFTVEPGLYLPGTGGIRYEDTVVLTDTGYRNFTPIRG